MPNLNRRLETLEADKPDKRFGALILTHDEESREDAIARHEADHGPIEGEVMFIELTPYFGET